MAEAHNDDSLEEFISEFAAFYSLPTSVEEEKFEAQAASPPPGTQSTTASIINSEEADLVKEFLSEFAAVYSLDSTKIEVTTTVTSASSSSLMKKKKTTFSNIIKQQPETPIATYTIETTLPDGDVERVLANYISGGIAFSREEKKESRSFIPKRMKNMFTRKKTTFLISNFFQQASSMIKNGATSDDDTSSSSSRGTTSCPAH